MNCQSGRKQIPAPSPKAPKNILFKNVMSYMNMQTTSGVTAIDHGRKMVAWKKAAVAAGDRGELPEDSCLAPSFGLAGFWVAPSFGLASLGGAEGRTMIYEVSKDPYL